MSPIRVILLMVCLAGVSAVWSAERPPNVVIIYADDMGYADISYNSDSPLVHTPHIDRLCEQGIYLDTQLTHYVCSPSRAGLLTGQHYTQVGSALWVGGTLDIEAPNIARTFQDAGYRTMALGKWHNGNPPLHLSEQAQQVMVEPFNDIFEHSRGAHAGPGVRAYGFDEWVGFYDGGIDYHNRFDGRQVNWWRNERYAPEEEGYLTDMIGNNAVQFIDQNHQSPFMLYVSMGALHAPYHILNTDLKAMCDVVAAQRPELAWEHVKELVGSEGRKIGDVLELRCHRKEEFDRSDLNKKIRGLGDLVYATLAYSLDRTTGDILDALQRNDIQDDTIVVFTSDNGASGAGDNTPFRGQKMEIWEGGIRVPAVIWQPGVYDATVPAYADAGSNRYSGMTQYIDWYPTLATAAGLGDQLDFEQLDGIDISAAILANEPLQRGGSRSYFGLYESWAVIRTDRWKLHYNMSIGADAQLALYDVQADVSERNNVADQHPEVANQLATELLKWMREQDLTASYLPVTKSRFMDDLSEADRQPHPEGDVLRLQAERSGPIADGFYINFAANKWVAWPSDPDDFDGRNDCHIFPGDVLQFDIFVESGSQTEGVFMSPSYYQYTNKTIPLINATKGLAAMYDQSGFIQEGMLRSLPYPTGKWIRCFVGMGDAAPSVYRSAFVALFGDGDVGHYDVLFDNVVIRGHDGSVRAVIWQNDGDHNEAANVRIGAPDGRYHRTVDAALEVSALDAVTITVEPFQP